MSDAVVTNFMLFFSFCTVSFRLLHVCNAPDDPIGFLHRVHRAPTYPFQFRRLHRYRYELFGDFPVQSGVRLLQFLFSHFFFRLLTAFFNFLLSVSSSPLLCIFPGLK